MEPKQKYKSIFSDEEIEKFINSERYKRIVRLEKLGTVPWPSKARFVVTTDVCLKGLLMGYVSAIAFFVAPTPLMEKGTYSSFNDIFKEISLIMFKEAAVDLSAWLYFLIFLGYCLLTYCTYLYVCVVGFLYEHTRRYYKIYVRERALSFTSWININFGICAFILIIEAVAFCYFVFVDPGFQQPFVENLLKWKREFWLGWTILYGRGMIHCWVTKKVYELEVV